MKILFKIISLTIFFGLIVSLRTSFAQTVQFPVTNLGNCKSQRECYEYCEIPENKPACWAWKVYGNKNVLGDESPEIVLKQLNIAFPIPELGNCPNLSSCKDFCSHLENKTICAIYSEKKTQGLKKQILEKSLNDLNCATWEECRNFCSQKANQTNCRDFSIKYQLNNPIVRQIIDKGKENFGCTSLNDCKNFCLNENNRNKCLNFTQKYEKLLLNRNRTPIGCQTNQQCQKECAANPQKCPDYPVNQINKPVPVSPNPPSSRQPIP